MRPGGVARDENRQTVRGVYVAGDVSRDVQLAIIAAAEGARAALAINKSLLTADQGTYLGPSRLEPAMPNRADQTWTFSELARRIACLLGTPAAFAAACAAVVLWAMTGPGFGFSDTWQLVINTGTTIVTFLMVFLVQNTQNRDARALHLKLDELLRSVKDARNKLIDLEHCTDEELDRIERQFRALRHREEHENGEDNPNPVSAKEKQRA